MGKTELGTKRTCGECGTRFYDLARNPIVCPKCGTVFAVVAATATAAKPKPAAAKPVEKAPEPQLAEDEEIDEALVPLEDVDAEEEDTGRAETEVDDEIPDLEDDEAIGDGEEEEFLEDDEDEGDDVTDLIDGDLEDDEEV